nr:receptor-like protein 7 [Ziziphus jujuba var. spinosa]
MKVLTKLALSGNNLSLLFEKGNINTTTSKFIGLGLASCNLGEFPDFLRHQNQVEWLSLANNKISGEIPKWVWNTSIDTLAILTIDINFLTGSTTNSSTIHQLGSLPVLKILTLQQNEFYGVIGKPKNYLEFPKLRVIHISFNYFTGELPSHYIVCWNAMKDINHHPLTYLSVMLNYSVSKFDWVQVDNSYAITITTKSVKRYYGAMQDIFTFIDMSSNRFEGHISELFGNIKGLYSLNLSNNLLTGRIPQGNQFNAFESSSFEGNPGLCGDPLLKKCGDLGSPSLPPSVFEENDDSDSFLELDWKVVLIGFIIGVVAGIALSDILLVLHIVVPDNISFVQSFCHDNERSSLLKFKESFLINKSGSLCDPKVLQWKSLGVNTSNCCSWDGVRCDEETGHVIGLDLSRGCLFGSINSNSTLFNLVHLQRLNLAGNNFNYSEIPFAIGRLSGLTYLNLSMSSFRGQIPKEISHLFKLSQLDLSFNYNENVEQRVLELKNPNLSSLLQNLTGLEVLDLSYVNISSVVPNFLSNFTSLASLFLCNSRLRGEFPATIFQLPNLRFLDVGSNRNLKGYLPEFKHKSPLKELILHKSGFSGILPSSIQMLDSLDLLDVVDCNFSGFVPSSLGKLAQLTAIHLGNNNFVGRIPSSL